MKKLCVRTVLFFILFTVGCGNSLQPPNANPKLPFDSVLPNTAYRYLSSRGSNVMEFQIGRSEICGRNGYVNEPCLSVTVCIPGTSQCQTVSDILIDTGSVGLRIFSSALTLPLVLKKNSTGQVLAQCAQFGTGSDWGPVASADVILGGEKASNIPIQIIDRDFSSAPMGCIQADRRPEDAGFKGILGVGLFKQDCGNLCASDRTAGIYFACDENNCGSIMLTLSEQIQNPIFHLPVHNNGLILALPQVNPEGEKVVSGVMILGIETSTNNIPTQEKRHATNEKGNFTTIFNGQKIPDAFIDSGSNGFLFPNLTFLPSCSESAAGFYCPLSPQEFTANNISVGGGTETTIAFRVGNAESLVKDGKVAFNNLAARMNGAFDWGLPFFYGRAVFEGIEGRSSSFGVGPYWAY